MKSSDVKVGSRYVAKVVPPKKITRGEYPGEIVGVRVPGVFVFNADAGFTCTVNAAYLKPEPTRLGRSDGPEGPV